jgi:hypothetical protein
MVVEESKMDLAIAMTTAPRRRPTLPTALASLRAAGFVEDVYLFAEPGTFDQVRRPRDARTIVHENGSTRGCFRNWRRAVKRLLSRTSAPWILVVQDDATWVPWAADLLRAQMIARRGARVGVLSPYVTGKDVLPTFVDGWNECRVGWTFWGALAFAMPRDAAEDLLRHPRFTNHRGAQQVDAVVSASMLDLGRPIYVHVPSLVDHVGDTSTVGHDDIVGAIRGYRFGER